MDDHDLELDARHEERQALEAKVKAQEELLAHYRRFVGKLATHPDKNRAWYVAKEWAPVDLWRGIGFDLSTPEEQQAFLFQ